MRRAWVGGLGTVGIVAGLAWLLSAPRPEGVPAEEDAPPARPCDDPEAAASRPPLLASPTGRRPLVAGGEAREAPRAVAAAPLALPPSYGPERRADGPYACGVVLDEQGAPVPGAHVECAWMDPSGRAAIAAGRTTTDETGRYVLAFPSDRPFHRRTIRAHDGRRASGTQEVQAYRFQRIQLEPAVVVSGQVRDAITGRALCGAAVVEWGARRSGWGWDARGESAAYVTDDAGRFRFLAPRFALSVGASSPGYAFRNDTLCVASGAAEVEVDLALARARPADLRGRLLDRGRPVGGAAVHLRDPDLGEEGEPLATTISEGDGRFAFQVPGGRAYALTSSFGPLVAGRLVDRERHVSGRVQTLDLLPSVSVAGLVTCGGRPAAGVDVELRCPSPRQRRTTRTDGLGRYRFVDVGRFSGAADLEVSVPGSSWWVGPAVPVRVTASHAGEVVADPIDGAELRVRGHVRDEAGRPIARAVVGVPGQGAVATTDFEGGYEFVGLGHALPLEARAPGYVPDPTEAPEPADGSVRDFVLRRGGTLFGRLVGDRGRSVGLVLDAPGSAWFALAVTNPDGSWVAEDVPGAPIRLDLQAGGGEPVTIEGLVPDSVVPDVVLRRE